MTPECIRFANSAKECDERPASLLLQVANCYTGTPPSWRRCHVRSIGPRRLVRLVVTLLGAYIAGTVPAAGGDFYIGAAASTNRLNDLYDKAVDNSKPQNTSLKQGLRVSDEASAAKLGYRSRTAAPACVSPVTATTSNDG